MANESFQCLREERERLCVCVCQKFEYLCVSVCVFTGLVVGCLGICVGRRAGADGGVRGGQLARIASHTQHTCPASDLETKAGHHQRFVVVLMSINELVVNNDTLLPTSHCTPLPFHLLPLFGPFFCPPGTGHSTIMGNNLLQKMCIFGRGKTCEMRP